MIQIQTEAQTTDGQLAPASWTDGLPTDWESIPWSTLVWGAILFFGSVVASMLVIGVLLVKLPATFFLDSHSREFWEDRHPAPPRPDPVPPLPPAPEPLRRK